MIPYTAVTEGIAITVHVVYLDGESDAMKRRFAFGYQVRIENQTEAEVQLLRRRWVINDGDGRVKEVEGEGVVGQQPVIAPGESHSYQSFCVIPTFEGSMTGTYLMQRASGERFRAQIPRFFLAARTS
jgi:ApaG protein